MQKYGVDSFSADGADEFNVYFFDIYTDKEKNNINWIGQKFPNLQLGYYFGTNEGGDAEDGFTFEVNGIEATKEEVDILQKFHISGECLKQAYLDGISDHITNDTYETGYDKYNSVLDIPEEVFQSYPFELTEYDYCEEDGNI